MTSSEHRHPVDVLIAEHEVILQVLDAIAAQARKLSEGGTVDQELWKNTTDFIVMFADRRHHGKEEDLLFPAMVEQGFPAEQGPIGVMKAEHVQGRDLTRRMREAAAAGDADELRDAASGYVFLLRDHIMKENQILFEMARQSLPPEAADALWEPFRSVDATMDAHGDFVEVARRLCAESGLDFRDPGGPTG